MGCSLYFPCRRQANRVEVAAHIQQPEEGIILRSQFWNLLEYHELLSAYSLLGDGKDDQQEGTNAQHFNTLFGGE